MSVHCVLTQHQSNETAAHRLTEMCAACWDRLEDGVCMQEVKSTLPHAANCQKCLVGQELPMAEVRCSSIVTGVPIPFLKPEYKHKWGVR